MRAYCLIVVIALLACSCATQKKCNRKFPPQIIVLDSVHTKTEITYRDTVIYTPADTVTLIDTIDCDELGRVNMPERVVKSNQATVKVAIKDNELRVEANCDSLEIELEKMKAIHTTTKTHTRNEVQIKKEKFIPSFYQFTFWWFIITASIIGLYAVFKILRRQLPF